MLLKFARLPIDKPDIEWLVTKAGAGVEILRDIANRFLEERRESVHTTTRIFPLPKIEKQTQDLVISEWVIPHPVTTFYVRVPDNFMVPQFRRGDRLFIDASETDPWELEEGTCVAVYRSPEHAVQQHWPERQKEFEESHPKEEVEERKRLMVFPYQHIGLFVGWLQGRIEADADGKWGHFFLEAPWIRTSEMLSVRQPHHPIDAKVIDASGLIVLGRVIAWLHSDRDTRSEPRRNREISAPSGKANTGKEKRK